MRIANFNDEEFLIRPVKLVKFYVLICFAKDSYHIERFIFKFGQIYLLPLLFNDIVIFIMSRRMMKAGQKAFDACDVKSVKFSSLSYPPGVDIIKTDYAVIPKKAKDVASAVEGTSDAIGRWYGGSRARLDCPYTEDAGVEIESQFNNHLTKEIAYDSLRSIAATIACRTCQYSSMTPVEVTIRRTEFAAAEAERLKAFALLEEARQEVAAILQQLSQD